MFGDKLRELRENAKLTQESFGEMFGVTSNAVYSWEKGKTQPSIEIIKEISKYYGVSVDYLFGFTQEDMTKIKQLNQVAREAGLIKGEDMTMEEFKKAIDIVEVLRGNNDQMEKKN